MTEEEINEAEQKIGEMIPGFNYRDLISQITDADGLLAKYKTAPSGYEKIQLFRLLRGRHDDDVITKFINESYHIENEFVMQLDPWQFDSIPEYVVQECDRLLNCAVG